MRKNSLYLVLVTVMLALTLGSCHKKKEKSVEEKVAEMIKPRYDLTQADTTEVLSLTQHFLQLLKDNQVEDAIAMLYFYKNDSIQPLPRNMADRQRFVFNTFRGVKYEIEKMAFLTPIDNEVVYLMTMFEKKEGDPRPNEMRFVLKPIRYADKWYLTMADSPTRTINLKGTEIKH